MKNMKIKTRIINFILMFFVVAMMMPVTASARGEIDLSQPGDLTLMYRSQRTEDSDEVIPMVGEKISIYKIADVDKYGNYSIPEKYKDAFPITDINKIKDMDSWKVINQSLGGYIYQNDIRPSATVYTDEKGQAHFTDLELGIYFVGNMVTKVDNYVYSFASFLIAVPGLDENDQWIHEVVGTVKCKITYEPKIDSFEILKNWNDSGYENYRPASIQVTIFCDGNEYAVVTLDQDNNWRYTWEYEEGHEWTLAETVNGSYAYTTSLTVSGTTFRLTNTVVPPETPDEPDKPDTPDNPDTPPEEPEEPGIPDLPSVLGAIRDLPQVLGARRLPQTGQLWWPIPILVIVGLAFIIIGIRKNNKNL